MSFQLIFNLVQDSLTFAWDQAPHHFLSHIFRGITQKMFQFLGVKLLNDFLLAFDNIRVLLMELIQSSFIFEQHFQKSSSSLQHFIQSVV